jgi:hypothetical protein
MARLRLYRCWPSPALGNSEIPGQRDWVARLRRLFPVPVCLQFGTERGGKRARAWRIETVRPGAATRERSLEGGGEKRFGVTAGCHAVFVSARAAAAGGSGFRQCAHSVASPGTQTQFGA